MLAQEMERLAAIMARLRAEGGCPWDREQTHKTLKPYLIEEAYEVLEAIDASAVDKLQEELGDVLLQVVFHAQVAAEAGEFDLAAVAKTIADKLVRRHPHVFGEISVDGVASVLANWERIKGHEYGEERTSVLAGVPAALPALMRAEKIQAKAARVGFDWPDVSGALVKVDEEMAEFREVLGKRTPARRGCAKNSATCSSPWSMWRGISKLTPRTRSARPWTSSAAVSVISRRRPRGRGGSSR